MIKYGYASRNIPDDTLFESVYERRLAAKKAGDKVTADSLKLIVNTAYGGMLNEYSELYDPLHARSVCISGQCFLIELIHSLDEISSVKLI